MNKKPLFTILAFLLTVCANVNAQHTFKLNDKGPAWTYNTIAELHDLAKKHLAVLDEKIATKKSASESSLNPFNDQAKAKYHELLKERLDFLGREWTCPHKYWQKCSNCNGTGNRTALGMHWWGTTCSVCNGGKGHFEDSHPKVDAQHSCSPATIRALLKIKD